MAFFFSGSAPYRSLDEKYPFTVNRHFYYLTGLDKEDMTLMLVNHNGVTMEYLFIEPFNELEAKWVGGRMSEVEASKISQVNAVLQNQDFLPTLQTFLHRTMNQYDEVMLYVDLHTQEYNQETTETKFAQQVKSYFPHAHVANVYPYIAQLRLVKDDEEIETLKRSIETTRLGIESMMKHAEPKMMEYELEAYFDFELKCHNADHSFPSIIAGGKNATILHYGENNTRIKDRSLVLCDLGAAHDHMCADITRTFPINGKFTKRQAEIYDIVLRGNKMIIDAIKPGMTLAQLNRMLVKFYQKELKEVGLLSHGKTVSDYYWHGVSHMLGLDTHDVSLADYQLQEGNVFTVEPGLYIEEENIGIRIEDNVLVTSDGCINLSADIIKEIADIEAFMQK
ncbi:MAG: Xaa-Pro aminopeptidase [Longicatena sp.]|nr:Xaa-Pro aminopeptidase [Longicatena sp.]